MRVALSAAVLTGVLALPASRFAEGLPARNSHAGLFTALPKGVPLTLPPAARPATIHTVVCGMAVVEDDSTIDAATAHHPSANVPAPAITEAQPATCTR